ncbi:MAG: type II secretion system major pseudopilin GspG [Deltaproteobacteria bacterium]|nr:type II secretion system major pseudopilin GspG [Deltaproteobacteria bacterium]MDL1960386.1 type II secretion system major pseudopilin GspG [Deltaproteobacteria bacterium]
MRKRQNDRGFIRGLGRDSGFTLIELLVVVIIIGLLASLVAPKFFGKLGMSRQKTAKAQIELFGAALDEFRLDNSRYPDAEEGLFALRDKPDGLENWSGPYLPKAIPKDPWGHDYVYSFPGEHYDYDLVCYGRDGEPGGEDEDSDIVSWE